MGKSGPWKAYSTRIKSRDADSVPCSTCTTVRPLGASGWYWRRLNPVGNPSLCPIIQRACPTCHQAITAREGGPDRGGRA